MLTTGMNTIIFLVITIACIMYDIFSELFIYVNSVLFMMFNLFH